MKTASIVIGIVDLLLLITAAALFFAGFYLLFRSTGTNVNVWTAMTIAGLALVVIALVGALVGIVLGAIALFGQAPDKTGALVGVGLNVLAIVTVIGSILYLFVWIDNNVRGRPFG
ncbi:MAG: hypothetical protein JSS81_17655 [Acidobacteria bacterium]|nr:hypothetical protein [Acidobacteriota bacterium]